MLRTHTQLGLLNGVYGGLGQSLGSLIGGDLVRKGGISSAFYQCAAVDAGLLGVFGLYQYALRRSSTKSKEAAPGQ